MQANCEDPVRWLVIGWSGVGRDTTTICGNTNIRRNFVTPCRMTHSSGVLLRI